MVTTSLIKTTFVLFKYYNLGTSKMKISISSFGRNAKIRKILSIKGSKTNIFWISISQIIFNKFYQFQPFRLMLEKYLTVKDD